MVLNKYYLHLNTFQLHRIMTSAIFFLQAATLFWSAYRYFYATQQRWFQLPSFPSISFILLLPQTLEFKSKRQSSNCVWTHTHTLHKWERRVGSASAQQSWGPRPQGSATAISGKLQQIPSLSAALSGTCSCKNRQPLPAQ